MEKLQKRGECGKLIVKDGWVICPKCKTMKLLRLPPDGKVKAYVYCRALQAGAISGYRFEPEPMEPEPHGPHDAARVGSGFCFVRRCVPCC